jgi:hypothetical protein
LSLYHEAAGKTSARSPDLLRSQYRLCRRHGARGNMFFSLPYLSDPLIDLFRTELYPTEPPPQTRSARVP